MQRSTQLTPLCIYCTVGWSGNEESRSRTCSDAGCSASTVPYSTTKPSVPPFYDSLNQSLLLKTRHCTVSTAHLEAF
jgi:hypothetical protein